MEQRAVDNLYQQIRRKEEEYNELESAYRMQKKVFEAKHEEIFDRKFQLARIADDEAGKLNAFLYKTNHSYHDGERFFQSLQQLMDQSDSAFRKRSSTLEMEEEKLDRAYRKERAALEEEVNKLRREYATANYE